MTRQTPSDEPHDPLCFAHDEAPNVEWVALLHGVVTTVCVGAFVLLLVAILR